MNNYQSYLKSSAWREKRKNALSKVDYKCEDCGAENIRLEVHHLNYNTIFNEDLQDLIVLCCDCHKARHNFVSEQRKYRKRKTQENKGTLVERLRADIKQKNKEGRGKKRKGRRKGLAKMLAKKQAKREKRISPEEFKIILDNQKEIKLRFLEKRIERKKLLKQDSSKEEEDLDRFLKLMNLN